MQLYFINDQTLDSLEYFTISQVAQRKIFYVMKFGPKTSQACNRINVAVFGTLAESQASKPIGCRFDFRWVQFLLPSFPFSFRFEFGNYREVHCTLVNFCTGPFLIRATETEHRGWRTAVEHARHFNVVGSCPLRH